LALLSRGWKDDLLHEARGTRTPDEGTKHVSIERAPSEYRQVAGIIRDRINAGEYTRGELLPKEDELAAELKVSRSVVNEALRMLRSEGLVRSVRGQGTRVHKIPVIRRDAVGRQRKQTREAGGARGAFDAEIRAMGLTPRVEVTPEPTVAPAHIAEVLGVDEGAPVLARKRVMFADDVPVQLATSWIPWDIAEGTQLTEVDTGPGGTYSRLAELGHARAKTAELEQVRIPDAGEAAALDMEVTGRVIAITRTIWDASGRAVEVNEMVLPAHQWVSYREWEGD
jgi:GntR family transcriptional regulator